MEKDISKLYYSGIYFLQYGDSEKITKIGRAAALSKRLRTYVMYSNEQRIQGYVVKCRNDGYILKQYENQFHNAFEQFYSHGEWYKIPVNFDYASFFESINVKYERFVHRIRPYYGNIKEKKPSYMTHDEWIKEEASNYKLLIERFLQLEKYEKMLDKPERIHNQA